MNDRLQIEDLLLGDGKEVVKSALITTSTRAPWKTARCSTPPTSAAGHSSA